MPPASPMALHLWPPHARLQSHIFTPFWKDRRWGVPLTSSGGGEYSTEREATAEKGLFLDPAIQTSLTDGICTMTRWDRLMGWDKAGSISSHVGVFVATDNFGRKSKSFWPLEYIPLWDPRADFVSKWKHLWTQHSKEIKYFKCTDQFERSCGFPEELCNREKKGKSKSHSRKALCGHF